MVTFVASIFHLAGHAVMTSDVFQISAEFFWNLSSLFIKISSKCSRLFSRRL